MWAARPLAPMTVEHTGQGTFFVVLYLDTVAPFYSRYTVAKRSVKGFMHFWGVAKKGPFHNA